MRPLVALLHSAESDDTAAPRRRSAPSRTKPRGLSVVELKVRVHSPPAVSGANSPVPDAWYVPGHSAIRKLWSAGPEETAAWLARPSYSQKLVTA
jgi:hypothetical protein